MGLSRSGRGAIHKEAGVDHLEIVQFLTRDCSPSDLPSIWMLPTGGPVLSLQTPVVEGPDLLQTGGSGERDRANTSTSSSMPTSRPGGRAQAR